MATVEPGLEEVPAPSRLLRRMFLGILGFSLFMNLWQYNGWSLPALPGLHWFDSQGTKLGRSWGKSNNLAASKGFSAAADALEAGGKVGDADVALQTIFQAERRRAFADDAAPAFAALVPEGAEPKTPEIRTKYVKLYRDFAQGLK